MTSVVERRVVLEGALNFRDLGGYATPNGMTRSGVLFRSDALSALTPQDIGTLLDLGLATVVDLRNARELESSPGVFEAHAAVTYHHNPVALFADADLPPHERLLALDFAAHNIQMARESSATFAYLFHLLAKPDAYPLVFHCAGGRDRTGVAAAMILTAAGVSRDDILHDYLISNEYLVPMLQRMGAAYRAKGIDPAPIMANLHLREEYLLALLNMLDADYGGIDGYLAAIGITPEELRTFRAQFVTDVVPSSQENPA